MGKSVNRLFSKCSYYSHYYDKPYQILISEKQVIQEAVLWNGCGAQNVLTSYRDVIVVLRQNFELSPGAAGRNAVPFKGKES